MLGRGAQRQAAWVGVHTLCPQAHPPPPPGPFAGMLSSAGAPISDWPGGQPGCSQLPVVAGADPVTMDQQVPPEAAGHTQVDPLTKHTWGTRSTAKKALKKHLKDQSPVVVFFGCCAWMDSPYIHRHPTQHVEASAPLLPAPTCLHPQGAQTPTKLHTFTRTHPPPPPPATAPPPQPSVGNTQRHLLRYFLHPTPTHLPASLARTKQTELHKCIRTPPPLSPLPPPLRTTQRHLLHCVLHHPHHAPTPHQPPQSLHPHPPTCRHPQG